MEEPPSDEIRVNLPGAPGPVKLPGGWSLGSEPGDVLTMVSPEGDLRVAFVIVPFEGMPEEMAAAAWRAFDSSFDFPVLQKTPMPGAGGWDAVFQVVYHVPEAQSRVAVAALRILGDKAYCGLIFGAKGAVSRRQMQVAEVLQNWKPDGLAEPSLAGTQRRKWEEKQSAEMGEFLRRGMAELHIPGAAIAVAQGGWVVLAEGFGVASIDSDEPVRPDTRFMIGSSTKPLTTLMMARLVALGKLDWSTPITKLLPGFALADPAMTRRLEIRHTASASTGMPRRDLDFIFKFKGITPEQRLEEMIQMKPTTGFGETFQYSNYLVAAGGYAAARSYLQEGPLQEAYERAMRELIFEPLGMRRTGFDETDGGPAASPHALDFEGNTVLIDPVIEGCVRAVAPAGAVWSTVPDMAQYLLLELNRGKLLGGEQLLPEEALLERRKRGIKITDKISYGLGLILSDEDGLNVMHHGGNNWGFSADVYFLPQEGLGVALLTNVRLANLFLAAARRKVFELLFDAPPRAEKMIAAASQAEKEAVAGRLTRVKVDADSVKWLEGILGEYRSNELGPLALQRKDGQYRAEFESWSSALGVGEQPDGSRVAVLTSPPWNGGAIAAGEVRLQVAEDGRVLVLDEGQTLYRFERQ
ncbi:MAG TPA: serine hydrolase domain-containing protein [Candidatus Acidoferrales bacterium]|nr:serine hydrolase domain-containing protein [Candidatus Acidoferrales bacterium]